jgi:hypothetical protein
VERFVGAEAREWKKKYRRKGGHSGEKGLKGAKCPRRYGHFSRSARVHAYMRRANVRIDATAKQNKSHFAQFSSLKFADNYVHFR